MVAVQLIMLKNDVKFWNREAFGDLKIKKAKALKTTEELDKKEGTLAYQVKRQ